MLNSTSTVANNQFRWKNIRTSHSHQVPQEEETTPRQAMILCLLGAKPPTVQYCTVIFVQSRRKTELSHPRIQYCTVLVQVRSLHTVVPCSIE
jgi:hypothetical protein